MSKLSLLVAGAVAALSLTGSVFAQSNPNKILNVSYDPTRELYKDFAQAFTADYAAKNGGKKVEVENSHGGSGKQARAVADGLEADVVTLALGYDIDTLVEAKLIDPKWEEEFPRRSTPYTSTIVFLVRKGNPKQIKDWGDLVRDDVSVITPNPKTSGGARLNYLAAYGWALKQYDNDKAKAADFLAELFRHVPVLDSGARGATSTFVQRGQGDVLLAWENEALLATQGRGGDKFEIVYPPTSILAEPPVAIVDRNVDKHGTRQLATDFLNFAYSPAGQEIAAKHGYRPGDPEVFSKYADKFKPISLFAVTDLYPGGWSEAHREHFAEGGLFDEIIKKK